MGSPSFFHVFYSLWKEHGHDNNIVARPCRPTADRRPRLALIAREPAGVAAAIIPWNALHAFDKYRELKATWIQVG
jgi:hypothetical protein